MDNLISAQDRFKPVEEVTWRDVNGEIIVLKMTSGEYFSFNEVGRLSWLSLAEGRPVEQVIEEIIGNYETSSDQAKSDLDMFISGLVENSLLEKEA